MSFTIDFIGGPAGVNDRARTDGVAGAQVTVTATVSASTYLVRIVNSTDPAPPTPVQDGGNPAIWRFTPNNGAQSYVIELITDQGLGTEALTRRIYAIREANSGLRYPAPMEKADPAASLFNNGAAIVAASEDNEDGSVFGWDPDMRAWLSAINAFYRELAIPAAVIASDAWLLTHTGNRYVAVDTRAGSQSITFGNATTNPGYTFAGTGNVSAGGHVSTPNVVLPERGTDPGTGADQGTIYTKDVSGNEELFFQDGARVIQITDGAGVNVSTTGEANTASNLGAGEGLFTAKSGVNLPFKSLLGGSGITLSSDATGVTITRDALSVTDLDDATITGAAQGDVLYFNGSAWVNLAPGTSGQFLQTQGAAANPIWASEAAAPITGVSNLGAGDGVFSAVNAGVIELKSLVGGTNITLTASGTEITIDASGSIGEANTASNVGAGAAIFTAKAGVDLPFRSIIGSTGITAVQNANDITLTASLAVDDLTDASITAAAQGDILYRNATEWVNLPAGTSGQYLVTAGTGANPSWSTLPASVTAATNLGAGEGVFGSLSSSTLQFKSLIGGTNVTLSSDANEITIDVASVGEANTASNLGAGQGIFTTKAGVNLPFKSLTGGTGITLSSTATAITITRDAMALNALSNVTTTGQVQGSILYRNASTWVVLNPGTSGQVLQTNGAAANPSWATVSGGSGEINTASNLGAGEGLFTTKSGVDLPFKSIVGGAGITLSSTATEVTVARDAVAFDDLSDVSVAASAFGDILYRSASGWQHLTAGTSGQFLQTAGAGAPPAWVTTIGEANTGQNLGTGANVFANKSGVFIRMRSILSSTSVTAVQNTNDISLTTNLAQAYAGGRTVTTSSGPIQLTASASTADALQIVSGALSMPDALRIGSSTVGSGTAGVTIGSSASSTTLNGAVTIGASALSDRAGGAGSNFSVTIGASATNYGWQNVLIGASGNIGGVGTPRSGVVAIGYNIDVDADLGIAIGSGAQAVRSVALGVGAIASSAQTVAIGDGPDATSTGSIALGRNAQATGTSFNIAIGDSAQAESGGSSISIGTNAGNDGTRGSTLADAISFGRLSWAALQATAIGLQTKADGDRAVAIGPNTVIGATADRAVAIGDTVTVADVDSIAIGTRADVQSGGLRSIALGTDSTASAQEANALGYSATSSGLQSIALGPSATASNASDVSIGFNSSVSGGAGIGVGAATSVSGANAVAVGSSASATAAGAVALGSSAGAAFARSMAFGQNAVTSAAQQVVFGASGATTRVTEFIIGDGPEHTAPGASLTIRATDATTSSNANGTRITIRGGRGDGTGTDGEVLLDSSVLGLITTDATTVITALPGETYLLTNGAARAVTFPETPPESTRITIKEAADSANAITISASGSDVFEDGSSTFNMAAELLVRRFIYSGGVWYLV